MPIKPQLRGLYPRDWAEISRKVRFDRAASVCQGCGRPHGVKVRCLPDGRWFDAMRGTWRNGRGRVAHWPDLVETAQIRHTRSSWPPPISITIRATAGYATSGACVSAAT